MILKSKWIEYLDVDEIKGAYLLEELKDEVKKLNAELQRMGQGPAEIDPRLYKRKNKSVFAAKVSAARLKLLDIDSKWIEKRKIDILEQNDMRRRGKDRLFKGRAKNELSNDFFCLKNTHSYKECNDGVKSFSFESSSESLYFDDDSIDLFSADHTGQQRNIRSNRESLGGTNILDDLGF